MIPNANNVKTITDMRERALELLNEVNEARGPLFIFHRSKPKAVLLAIEEYEKLSSWLEDYFDSLKAQEFERIDKKRVKWLSLEEIKKDLGFNVPT